MRSIDSDSGRRDFRHRVRKAGASTSDVLAARAAAGLNDFLQPDETGSTIDSSGDRADVRKYELIVGLVRATVKSDPDEEASSSTATQIPTSATFQDGELVLDYTPRPEPAFRLDSPNFGRSTLIDNRRGIATVNRDYDGRSDVDSSARAPQE